MDERPKPTSAMTFGEVAYRGYAKSTDNKTFDGREMPRWEDLPARVLAAWEAAANAAIHESIVRENEEE